MPSMRMRAPELANARTVMLLAGAAFLVLPAAAFVGVMPADAWIRGALFDGATPGLIRVMRWINYARSSWVILPGALLLLALERVWRRWWIWMGAILVASLLEPVLKEVVAPLGA